MAINTGDVLMGLGAAIGGTGPQFIQGLQQREQQLSERKRAEIEARQKAMYQDAATGLQLLAQGDLDGLIALGEDRLQLLQTFPDADPSDTQRIVQNARLAKQGDPVALRNLATELSSATSRGLAMGFVKLPEAQKPVVVDNALVDPTTGKVIYQGEEKPAATPAAIQELQWRAEQAGLVPGTPGYSSFMREGGGRGTNINVAAAAPTPPSGYRNIFDANGMLISQEPIPGGPVATSQAAQAEQTQIYNDIVIEDIGKIKNLVKNQGLLTPVTGLTGAVARAIPGSPAMDAKALQDTIAASISFDRLQAMRNASPSGGALGSVTENELNLLQSTLGSISLSQSDKQLIENLDRLEKIYTDVMKKFKAYPSMNNEVQAGSAGMQINTDNDPLGLRK